MIKSDETLYLEARKGSKSAFERLYVKYEGPLFGFILRRIGNRQDSEDVFHEAMTAIFKGPEADFTDGTFASWLYKVALNLSLNRQRKKSREHRALDAFANDAGNFERDEEDPAEDQAIKVQEASKNLSEPLIKVYDLRRKGKSYEEIATILDLPLGTIKSRVHLMVKKIRKELGL